MVLRRGLLWLLLVALVSVQALGLVHRIVHGEPAALSAEATPRQAADHDDGGRRWGAGLFGGHDEEGGCLLYDQLSHGGCLPLPAAVTLPVIAPAFLLQWFQGEFLARWAVLFDARGPPPVR